MIDGRPRKNEYRSFTIRSVQGIDDFASIKEVVYRRFRGLAERNEQLPDLLLIDGGKGQLTSAGEALDELGMGDQPIIGLAKRLEEVFVRGEKKAVLLPKTSAGLRTLQILRDEAHRFALNHHRHQRQKQTMRSALDSIPGVGPKRKRALLRTLGSVASIQKASAEEIGDVPGIGHALARVIKSALSK
jgi:excinuclease ABC subunit C